jgi:hypothetical protein
MIGRKKGRSQRSKEEKSAVDFREVLLNAIKMQALYSNGKIKYIETSRTVN